MTLDSTVVIRAGRDSDADALERLARLDSQRPLEGETLVVEQGGELVAAIAGDRVIADPFRSTAYAVDLLEARAGRNRRNRLHGARVRLPRLRTP
jgi:hypothetical protein